MLLTIVYSATLSNPRLVSDLLVVINSLWSLESETSIHQMVENACKVTLACALCR